MGLYGDGGKTPAFLALVLDRGVWSASGCGHRTSEGIPVIYTGRKACHAQMVWTW
jgi:hypothetical protein